MDSRIQRDRVERSGVKPGATSRPCMTYLSVSMLGVLLALGGCESTGMKSAQALIQQQQQQQALLRQQEDETQRKQVTATQPQVLLSLIREAQSQGRYFASLAYIDAYQQKFGNSVELRTLRGEALRKTGQTQASEQVYQSLLDTAEAAAGWSGLGLLAGARGDYAQAADNFARAAQLAPTDAQILSDLGYARLRVGNIEGARVPIGQAAELDPGNATAIGNLALLLFLDKSTAQAEQVMDQGQLSPAARERVQQLAAEIHASMAAQATRAAADRTTMGMPPQRVAQTEPGATGGLQAARPVVRNLETAAASNAAYATSDPSQSRDDDLPLPTMQPMLDRFGGRSLQ